MKKVAFFFGAGAEGKGNFNIRTGYEYLKSSLYASDALEGFDKALASFFDGKKFFNDKFVYRKNTLDVSSFVLKNFIIQKASHDKLFFTKYQDLIVTILSDEDLRHVCDVIGKIDPPKHKSSTGDEVKRIKDEFKEILTGIKEKYLDIENNILKELFEQDDKDGINFDLNIGVAGSLDSYFHTIIDPYKYSVVRFSKIFNYYWACYFAILHDVISFLVERGQKDFEKYITAEKELNYLYVLKNIGQLTKELYNFDISSLALENTYYQIIHQKLEEHKNEIQCVGAITTNYYRFCEIVSPNTIYLNGQLKCFEYPELLEVTDMQQETGYEDKLLFPFIFGQSLVKPIVNSIQTEEFHRLHKLLNAEEGADVLVVLGFNINEDDNHINAFLHDYVKKGKKLIIISGDEHFDVVRKLKCSESEVSVRKVTYGDNGEVVREMFGEIMDSSA